MGAFPFVISFRAFAGLTRNPKGNRALSFPLGSESEGRERRKRWQKKMRAKSKSCWRISPI